MGIARIYHCWWGSLRDSGKMESRFIQKYFEEGITILIVVEK
jgi:hypothetical protein